MCQRCHEMRPYYESWQQSAHKSIECAQCHIPSGTVGLLLSKIGALREVYVHFAGEGTMPLQLNSKVPRTTCLSCHPKPADVTYTSSSFSHSAHTSGACSDCHRGLFHPAAAPAKPVPAVATLGTMDNCLTCHDGTTAPKTCSLCHRPPHKTSGECSACHTPKGWNQPVALSASVPKEECLTCHPKPKDVTLKNSTFSHAVHKAEACVSCHNNQLHPGKKGSAPVSMESCLTCHDGTTAPKKCSTCHKAPHAAFALNGRHATLKCASCHKTLSAGKAAAALPTKCVGCHGDKHKGLTDCTRCHKTSGWTPANFAHPGVSGMNWRGMACSDCHPNGYASHTCTKCHGSNGPGD